ncbi:CASC3/Barentsz eIF4AIII binding-domain-containing protein [Annulohypoxylon maeteangense]|uniref:CASC3/Barentsz eIF4AIII binding-domain-containing protein n=1 Tax=Annulohypoxylon maeteangense TaxID=1927788 RepID=UPI0020088D99|nr:CASC3/Barentsz eIF4AIII binding-domain-containing protein [Annulohypoxylon maeteangense]KAI0885683.1 CASC3/Barentsz eIF4AIII binding-domain-containing protein [Annulohypoxylon maeteangense]
MVAAVRRRKMIGHRRRVEDEGEDDGGLDQLDIDDDSLTDGSMASEDPDPADDSDTSNVDEASPTTPAAPKLTSQVANGNGNVKRAQSKSSGSPPSKNPRKSTQNAVSDTAFMLNNLSISSGATPVQVLNFDESTEPPSRSSAPIVVSSNSATTNTEHPQEALVDRRRKEHEEYRRKRDEDPSFVPNRGAFFMHDHRHAGPSANGFRPFGRGPRGRGRGGIGGPYAPINHQMHSQADPTTNGPWAHDMHEVVAQPIHVRQPRPSFTDDGPPNGDGFIPTCPPSSTPINRTMATDKHVGNVQIRVFFPGVKEPIVFSGIQVRQYTKLPDHRPPLRRDKPVRISLPDFPPRYIFPATDRSFIFIPRAMRPNQRLRGKPRSGLGSIGGFSRRTSVFGGSVYAGSAYTPSIALSRRSSIAPDLGRDYLVSPTGSTMSRPPLPYDPSRPVVRLPPQARTEQQLPAVDGAPGEGPGGVGHPNINDTTMQMQHPVQKPIFQENRPVPLPMHQPRPQKTVSVAGIESPEMHQNPSQPYQQAFHQQVPVQVSTSLGQESHVRHPSYPSQHSTGTPLSQIPERAIHAAPFQPNQFPQQNYYQPYQMMQPQQGYYYPSGPYPGSLPPSGAAPNFIQGTQQQGQPQGETPTSQPNGQGNPSSNLVAQEVNGMVYYYDASQLPPMATYPYPAPQGYPMPGGVVGMNGMVTPTPDGYYYPPSGPGVVYYPQ